MKLLTAKLLVGNRTETSIPSLSMSLSRVGMSTCSMPPTSPPIFVSIPSEGNRGPRLECGSGRCFRTSASFSTIWPSASIVFIMTSFAWVHHDLLRMELVNKLMERSLVARLASVNRNARVYFSGSNVMAISFVVDIALQNNSLPSSLIRSACYLIETERDILTVKGVMPSVQDSCGLAISSFGNYYIVG